MFGCRFYRVIHHVVFGFIVAGGTQNITIMAGIGQMHARRDGRTQIWSRIVWLLWWYWWNCWSNAANRLIYTHIAGRHIVQCHMLMCGILVMLRQRTGTLNELSKLADRNRFEIFALVAIVLFYFACSGEIELHSGVEKCANSYLIRIMWWIVWIRCHVDAHTGQWEQAGNFQTTWVHWSGWRLP